jgi:nifR3 family TIM-barrel protein
MVKGFWGQLKKPLFVLAPMADVTDAAFRRILAKYGKPDVTWTEFVSADGLFLRPIEPGVGDQPKNRFEEIALTHGVGTDHPLLRDLMYTEEERPIVAQFFSRNPDRMRRAAALARDLGYDGIDINMGCPAQVICDQGAGAAIIKEPHIAQEIIRATMEGAGDLPVSVKTRIGFTKNEIETWLPTLLETQPACITLHARTRKDMSKVPAKWDVIERAVEIRDQVAPQVLIIGNGDVTSLSEAQIRVKESGCDGVMIGRGIFGNPYIFNPHVSLQDISVRERLTIMLEHTQLFLELLGDSKSFALMKKHYKAYVNHFEGAKELRADLMEAKTYLEIQGIVEKFLSTYEENL